MDGLIIDAISKSYGSIQALDHFDASLSNGIYGILGENGAGKTTLLNSLATLILPDDGTITYNGSTIHCRYYQSILGYLPQHFGYYPHMKLRQYLKYVGALKNVDGSTIEYKIESLTQRLDLSAYLDRRLKTLSGGMLQRVGIAQALINDPKILLLDEPTIGLDPYQRNRFKSLLAQLAGQTIIVLSSHIVSDIEDIADTIWLIKDGALKGNGSLGQLVKPLDGKVYETHEDQQDLPNDAIVVNVKLKPVHTIRFITDQTPNIPCIGVKADLNDVYMKLYG